MTNSKFHRFKTWTYEGYWNVVLGTNKGARQIVDEFELVAEGLDEWLARAESESWAQSGERQAAIPDEWSGFRERAKSELEDAIRE